MFRVFGLSLAACAALTASPALAHGNGGGNNDQLRIEITARIAERCGISPGEGGSNVSGNLENNETLTINFDIDCNTPFRIGVSSENGGLRLATAQRGDTNTDAQGFSIMKRYQVGLQVQTDGGLLDGGTCRSDELTSREGRCNFYGDRPGRGLSSGRRTAIDRTGTLTVSWNAQDGEGRRRVAGNYQDTLTIVVGPRT